MKSRPSSVTLNTPERKGFTTLELLVSMSVIGVLAGLVLPAIASVADGLVCLLTPHSNRRPGISIH